MLAGFRSYFLVRAWEGPDDVRNYINVRKVERKL
jgi:hypothetical protein